MQHACHKPWVCYHHHHHHTAAVGIAQFPYSAALQSVASLRSPRMERQTRCHTSLPAHHPSPVVLRVAAMPLRRLTRCSTACHRATLLLCQQACLACGLSHLVLKHSGGERRCTPAFANHHYVAVPRIWCSPGNRMRSVRACTYSAPSNVKAPCIPLSFFSSNALLPSA